MTEQSRSEYILRRRMHGLYLSRKCEDLLTLSHELMGLHCWFHRNVPFSALIRGAAIHGWKNKLTKTWLYRGTLHGVVYEDLPELLALHSGPSYLGRFFGEDTVTQFGEEVLRYMEDGVYSRTEFRKIFADTHDPAFIDSMFSSWGGVFVNLARMGKVAFRDMTSRDFDMISAEPSQTVEEVLPGLFHRYLEAYGPATLEDAAWFFGFWKDEAKRMRRLCLADYETFEHKGHRYYSLPDNQDTADIPALTLLSGFDPMIVSYTQRSDVLPPEHKSTVILKSGICLPTILVDGRVAGIWNIKKNQPVVEFFGTQPKRVIADASQRVETIAWLTR